MLQVRWSQGQRIHGALFLQRHLGCDHGSERSGEEAAGHGECRQIPWAQVTGRGGGGSFETDIACSGSWSACLVSLFLSRLFRALGKGKRNCTGLAFDKGALIDVDVDVDVYCIYCLYLRT